jgi:hypothetical protein
VAESELEAQAQIGAPDHVLSFYRDFLANAGLKGDIG